MSEQQGPPTPTPTPKHEPSEATGFERYPRLPPIAGGAGLALSAPAFAASSASTSAAAGAKSSPAAAGVGAGVPLGLVTEVLSRTSANLARVIDFQARVADRQEPDVAHRERAHLQYRHAHVIIGQLRAGDIFVSPVSLAFASYDLLLLDSATVFRMLYASLYRASTT